MNVKPEQKFKRGTRRKAELEARNKLNLALNNSMADVMALEPVNKSQSPSHHHHGCDLVEKIDKIFDHEKEKVEDVLPALVKDKKHPKETFNRKLT